MKNKFNLDPENWEETRALAHKMLDDMFDSLRDVSDKPVWKQVPESLEKTADCKAIPEGSTLEQVYEDFKKIVLAYPAGNLHPRFFGWVIGSGTVNGMLADMLASATNPNLFGCKSGPYLIEKQVINWLKQIFGFPETSGGLLVSGGTMANINALQVARNTKCGKQFRKKGLQWQDDTKPLTLYGSAETHSWINTACELMGIGTESFRKVPINENYQIDTEACKTLIEEDLRNGYKPFCIVGSVGTTNTGSIDDLEKLYDLARKYNLWFHVDGAFGSMLAFTSNFRHLIKCQEKADSIAFDLHKWGCMPYEVGCFLIKDEQLQIETFSSKPAYLSSEQKGISTESTYFNDRGIQLSRGFRALKVWFSLKEHGVKKIGKAIEKNILQAQYLKSQIENDNFLELLAPVPLNIVCFRYIDKSISEKSIDALNRDILVELQESGVALPSQTVLHGKFALRVCFVNHRTEDSDIDLMLDEVKKLGNSKLESSFVRK